MKRKLTESMLKKAKPKADGKDAQLRDGGGLFANVTGGGVYWRYEYRHEGKRRNLSIGSYPEVGLEEAREKHKEARALLARGTDPSTHKRMMKAANTDISTNSFEAIAREWFGRNKDSWSESHKVRTLSYLERDVFPWMGKLNINEVMPSHVIRVVQRVEARGAGDAARRVKQYILQVYKYAKTMEIAERNPAADIDNNIILQPRSKKHFSTITDPPKVGQLLRDMEDYQGSFVVRCALRLSALVMLRPGELRAAEWSEIDLEQGVWTIEVRRMKAPTHVKRANQSTHIIPLSRQAIEVFRELQPLTGRFKYVFPSARGASKPLSNNAVRAALRTMGYDNDTMTPHGFRGMASTLLNEKGFNPDAIERQLAHKDSNTIRAAYNRAEYLNERTQMMQSWADYLDELRLTTGKVLTFKTKAG